MKTTEQYILFLQNLMSTAIDEAKASLREGNSGFGALIVKDDDIIAQAHDTDKTDSDPTAHAEMKVIRSAAARLGKDLTGCILVSTHEPCPMCSTAALWAGIGEIAFGYSIKDALKQGRRRVDLTPGEIYALAGKEVKIYSAILFDQCAVLYDKTVREQVELLRDADEEKLKYLANQISSRRLQWFKDSYKRTEGADSPLDEAYQLFLSKLQITVEEAQIARREVNRLVIHSRNSCPTLEACKILKLDTRFVCRHLTEKPTNELVRQLNPSLRFFRNYDKLRPNAAYCEEIIVFESIWQFENR